MQHMMFAVAPHVAQVEGAYGMLKGYGPLAFGCVVLLVLIAALLVIWKAVVAPTIERASVKNLEIAEKQLEIAAKQAVTAEKSAQAAASSEEAAACARQASEILDRLIRIFPTTAPRHSVGAPGT